MSERRNRRNPDQWLILWCESDLSYSLIPARDAVYDEETLKVGDKVTFFFNKDEFDGTVTVIGGETLLLFSVPNQAGELRTSLQCAHNLL